MPVVYIRVELYNELVRRGHNPTEYINKLLEKALREEDWEDYYEGWEEEKERE